MQQIGRYEIERELGRGAMGVVYLARDTRIGRAVALKTIRLSDFADAEKLQRLRERLNREAQSAGILSHENIVTIYDVDELEGLSYISMEFVEGDSLERMLEKRQEFSRETLLSLLRQMAAGLDFAHSRGIVHRDIKPPNVMVSPLGRVKITDFGVAKVTHASSMTQGGAMLGTPDYMSPEQIDGRGVDGRADQFSLAVIAFEMLTGEKPFVAETLPALFYRIAHEQSPDATLLNPSLGPAIGEVLQRALAKKPDARFANCVEFVNALTQACAASPGWHALPRGMAQTLPTLGEPPAHRKTTEDSRRSQAGTQEHPGGMPPPRPSQSDIAPPPVPLPPPLAERVQRKEARSYGGGFITGEDTDTSETLEMPAPNRDEWLQQAQEEERQAQQRKRRTLLVALFSVLVVGGGLAAVYFSGALRSGSPESAATTLGDTAIPADSELSQNPAGSEATSAQTSADSATQADAGSAEPASGNSTAQDTPVAADPKPSPPATAPVEAKPVSPPRPSQRLAPVRFLSDPPGATVTVDASSALSCVTPCSLELPVGRHTYSLRLDRYRNEIRLIEVGAVGETVSVKLERRVGLVRVSSTPAGAAIYVNGQKRSEVTPATLRLPPGSYQIRVEKDGSTLEQDVDVQEDAAVQVQANLQ